MPTTRFTERTVTTLPPPKRGTVSNLKYWDEGERGLHVVVQASGTRTFRVMYRFKGSTKQHTLLIGRVLDVTLEEARDKARAVRRMAAKGEDPQATEPNTDSFKACLETWVTNEQVGRKECVSAARTQGTVLSACWLWHDRPIGSLHYTEIDDHLCMLRDGSKRLDRRPTRYLANRVHAHLKTFFRWCVRTKRLPVSPMAEMPKPWLGAKPRERPWFEGERADEVIKALWREADALGGDRGRFIKLVVITGKRRTAIQTMRWDEIGADWYWRPPIGSKSKRCHAIPLPKLAQRVLSPRDDKGRVLASLNPDVLAVEMREAIGVPDFIWHGVRHVVESKLAELRVPPHVRDMLLDHAAQRGAGKGYDHWAYLAERTEALELWCSHIEALVTPAGARMLR